MIEMKFYRDNEYAYINNPDGTTKRVPIDDFESAISGEGNDLQVSFTGAIDDPSTVIPISYNEIKNAVLSGKAVRLVHPYEGDDSELYTVYTLITFENDNGTYFASFVNGTIVNSISSDDPDSNMSPD